MNEWKAGATADKRMLVSPDDPEDAGLNDREMLSTEAIQTDILYLFIIWARPLCCP